MTPTTNHTTTNAPPAAPPSRPGLGQRALRTILHALVIIVVMHTLAPALSGLPLPLLLLVYVRPAHYVPFAVGLAGGLNADRIILLTLALVIILATWPDNILPYAIAGIIGIVLGASIRALIIQEKTNG